MKIDIGILVALGHKDSSLLKESMRGLHAIRALRSFPVTSPRRGCSLSRSNSPAERDKKPWGRFVKIKNGSARSKLFLFVWQGPLSDFSASATFALKQKENSLD